MSSVATFDQRIAIQILAIDDDIKRWNFELNGRYYQDFMSGLMLIFGLIVWIGKSSLIIGDIAGSVKFTWIVVVIIIVSIIFGVKRRRQ